jgi:hypothetical protein
MPSKERDEYKSPNPDLTKETLQSWLDGWRADLNYVQVQRESYERRAQYISDKIMDVKRWAHVSGYELK